MDYLLQIKTFHDWLVTNQLHSDSQSLWFTLINIRDKSGEKQFTVMNNYLTLTLGISNTQLTRARNLLIQAGRIKYRKRTGRSAGIYEIIEFVNHNGEQSVGKVDTKRMQKPSNPATKPVLKYFQTKFEEKFKETPTIDYGKDGALIKSLLNTYGEEKLKGLIDVFFESDDPYITQSSYTIGFFKTVINKLLINKKSLPKAYSSLQDWGNEP